MTDVPSPDDDLLISAYLDDVATPDERAAVETDPVRRARLADFQAVHDRVAEPVSPPSAEALDAMLAAAFAEADAERAAAETATATGTPVGASAVTSLGESRARRSRGLWLSVAAVVLLALAIPVGIALGNRHGSGSSDDVAASASTSNPGTDAAGVDPGVAVSDPEGTRSTPTKPPDSPPPTGGSGPDAPMAAQFVAGDLGAASTDDELRLLVNDAVTNPPSSAGPSTTEQPVSTTVDAGTTRAVDVVACEPAAQSVVPDAQALRLSGQLTYAGQAAYGYVFVTPAGLTAVIVSSDPARSCEILAQLAL